MSGEASGSAKDPNGGFLPYQLDYIPEDLMKRAKHELSEDDETRTRSLALLRCLMKDDPDMNWLDDDLFLLSFLRARKFDVGRAFQLIKNFYSVGRKHEELFDDFNFAEVKRTTENNFLGCLPFRDSEGTVIIIMNLGCWNPPDVSMGDMLLALACALLHANLSPATQIAGFKVIVDFSDFTVGKLTHVTATYAWVFASALQNCFPGRFPEIHVVNQGSLFSYVWVILKQFLSKKIKDRFHFHGKNLDKLCKYISPNVLPVEYGGKLPPFDNAKWRQMLEEKADYYGHAFSPAFRKRRSSTEENLNGT